MCGIAGFIEKRNEPDDNIALNMLRAIKHRGPDDYGTEKFTLNDSRWHGILGFVRLSIRDLSKNGHQPMISPDGNVVLAFNGEIYNADEIKNGLIELGKSFVSTTDTEVILNSYLEYGLEKTIEKLNGMFAICIVDKRIDKMYIIRDRVGEKPIFYYENDDIFLFASEQKAFYEHEKFIPELNDECLDEQLIFRYIANGKTLLKNVYIVRPGCYLEIENGNINEYCYWNICDNTKSDKKHSNNYSDFNERLCSSIKSRLVSDVPVGVELSGGVDSSVVTYIASKNMNDLKAYSIIFENENVNEEQYIDYVSEETGVPTEKMIFSIEDFIADLEKCTWHFDAPINHEGSIALYHLCKNIKRKCPVILTGEGADELFAGYEWYYSLLFDDVFGVKSCLSRLYRKLTRKQITRWKQLKSINSSQKYVLGTAMMSYDVWRNLRKNRDITEIVKDRESLYDSMKIKGIKKKLNYEMTTYMTDLLLRQDKMSMAGSIECRVPFLDQELIEYVRMNIPNRKLISCSLGRKKNTKIILKEYCEKIFGKEFTYRTKMGLPLPLEDFYNESQFIDYFENTIFPGIEKRGYINSEYVWNVWSRRNNFCDFRIIWIVSNLELWIQLFVDNNGEKVRTINRMNVE